MVNRVPESTPEAEDGATEDGATEEETEEETEDETSGSSTAVIAGGGKTPNSVPRRSSVRRRSAAPTVRSGAAAPDGRRARGLVGVPRCGCGATTTATWGLLEHLEALQDTWQDRNWKLRPGVGLVFTGDYGDRGFGPGGELVVLSLWAQSGAGGVAGQHEDPSTYSPRGSRQGVF